MTGKIYKIYDKKTSKYYIGQTSTSLKVRFQKHLQRAKTGKLDFYKELNSRPNDFEISLIEETEDESKLIELEKKWIKTYKEKYPNKVYNIRCGGGVKRKTLEEKEKEILLIGSLEEISPISIAYHLKISYQKAYDLYKEYGFDKVE